MTEKELAKLYVNSLIEASKEINTYAMSIRLDDEQLKNKNIDKLIEEIKKLKFFADYQYKVKHHRYTKVDKNSLFISSLPIEY